MGRARMTTGRWMVFIAVFAGSLAGLDAFHRWVTSMFAGVMEQARIQRGLPPGTDMSGFIIRMPSSRQMLWLDLDHFLLRFWFVVLPLILLLSFGAAMLLPARKIKSGPGDSGAKS
jgi:hypothetical protein